jgi:hypothetical protein
MAGDRLGNDPAQAIEIENPIDLAPETGGAGGKQHGILKPASEDLDREIRLRH